MASDRFERFVQSTETGWFTTFTAHKIKRQSNAMKVSQSGTIANNSEYRGKHLQQSTSRAAGDYETGSG